MRLATTLLLAIWCSGLTTDAGAQGNVFTYQGRLSDTNGPLNTNVVMTFRLYAAPGAGAPVWQETHPSVAVTNGLFSAALGQSVPVDATIFNGDPRWLGISVNGGAELVPRTAITAAPYAIAAGHLTGLLPPSGLAGTYSAALTFNNPANAFNGNGVGLTDLNASQLTSGTVPDAALGNAWKLGGNADTTVATQFLGTTDNQALELRVNNTRIARFEPGANVVLGNSANEIGNGLIGSTIGGGRGNTNAAHDSTIAGGVHNRIESSAHLSSIGGGWLNIVQAGADQSAIAGGNANRIQTGARESFIGGGFANSVRGPGSVIGGGAWNTNSGVGALIGGGERNMIQPGARFATVPGGHENSATNYGFAAGRRAKANHTGGFVWADSTDADFASTSSNQFLIRAGGGVGIGTTEPKTLLALNAGIGGGDIGITQGRFGLNTFELTTADAAGEPASRLVLRGGNDAAAVEFLRGAAGAEALSMIIDPNGRLGIGTVAPGNLFVAEGPGTTLGGVPGFNEVVARIKRTGASHTALAVDAEVGQDAVLYLAENGVARWALRHDADQGHELDIRYSPPGAPVGLEALKLTTNGDLIISGTINGTIANSAIASAQIADASIGASDVNATSFSTTFWKTDGNAGTTPGAHFLGTTDNQPMEFKVNGVRALRLEPGVSGVPNVIGGASNNQITAGVFGATIGGGRENAIQAGGDGGTISGGRLNAIENAAAGATISGGRDNTIPANADFSTVAGGIRNIAGGNNGPSFTVASTVGGGDSNFADAPYATIGGGVLNTNTGFGATIPGGRENVAAGHSSFAAGRRAKANHAGAFVWADSSNADFASTGDNQFLIRAGGGVGVGTASPQASLHLYATNNPTIMRIQSTGFPGFGRLEFMSDPQGSINEWRPAYVQSVDNGNFTGGLAFFVNGSEHQNRLNSMEVMRLVNGRVGIGTTNPANLLLVEGLGTTNGGVLGFPEVVGRFKRTGASHSAVSIDAETGRDSVLYLAENGATRWAVRHDADQNHELDIRYSITPGSSIEALRLSTNGTLITAGPVNPPSDRNVKTAFQPVNAQRILEKVTALPLMTWAYTNAPDIRHIGPVAQDFHTAFGVGTDDKHIATVDADGVALAAIQGLNQKLEEALKARDAELRELRAIMAELKRVIAQEQ